LFPGGSATRMH